MPAKAKAKSKKTGKVEGNVVWISDESVYREVLDDSKPEIELGGIVHPVTDNESTGEGHFEYGPDPGSGS